MIAARAARRATRPEKGRPALLQRRGRGRLRASAALALILPLLLAGCGVDGLPLRPDGTPETGIEAERDVILSTSPGWTRG